MGSDARDVLGLPSTGPPKPATPKVQKPKVRGPSRCNRFPNLFHRVLIIVAGMSREVLDLKYEGAPPISIVAPKFKEKPKLPFKPRPWEETPFGNSARKDGLILRHWRRKGDVSNAAALPVTPADSNAASEMEQDEKAATALPDSHWAKFNVKVDRPHYTDEQYETHLKNDDWSKEETDYLVELATDFDLRWVVIADRYEYQPKQQPTENEDSMAVTLQAKPRTQEDMKARYYDVAAKTMVLHNPLSSMSSSEFDAHEKMTKYNPEQEKKRKMFAEQLMSRTDEEKYEEEMLLKELSRIVLNQEKLFNERKALYDRLGTPPGPPQTHSTAMYQSSQGLTQLMQSLLAQNKSKELEKKEKRRSAMGAEGEFPGGASGLERSHRQSISGGLDKRYSFGHGGPRQLSAREEQKYGVSHPNERLTGGVQFRHERITKAGQAKSGVQTSRISAALTELKIPHRLTMPTAKVVTEYEKLIEGIKTLLEVRKLSEKLDGEIKVWQAQKEQQEAKDRGEEVKEEEPGSSSSQAVGNENENENEEEEEEEEDTKEIVDEQAERRRKAEAEDDDDDDDEEEEGDDNNNDDDDGDEDKEGGKEEQEEEEDEEEESDEDVSLKARNKDAQAGDHSPGNQDGEEEEEEEEEGEDEDEEMPDQAQTQTQTQADENNENEKDDDDPNANQDEEEGASSPASASAAPTTTRSEGLRKRSASVISHVSNKSSKRQRR